MNFNLKKLNKLFSIFICIYFATYLLPFAETCSGLELEVAIWNDMINNKVPDFEMATIFSLRWLTNIIIIFLWALNFPELNNWMSVNTDKLWLDKLLLIVLFLFVTYPFIFESIAWQYGGLLWAFSAIATGLSFQLINAPVPEIRQADPGDHLIELKEAAH